MAYRRREHDPACRCGRADSGCAALAVRRLSRTRVQELAEEIWTVSNGTAVLDRPVPDPRGSMPGAILGVGLMATPALVLHDVALPGWSASLDHLVIGPTGAWAIETWQHRWLPRPGKAGAPAGRLSEEETPWTAIRRSPSTG